MKTIYVLLWIEYVNDQQGPRFRRIYGPFDSYDEARDWGYDHGLYMSNSEVRQLQKDFA